MFTDMSRWNKDRNAKNIAAFPQAGKILLWINST